MILTADRFEQLVSTLKSDVKGFREKRQAPRVGLRAQVRVVCCSKASNLEGMLVWLKDVSATGIGFTFPRPMQPGQFIIACLPKGRQDMLRVLYRVMRCHRLDESQFSVGAQMERVLNDRESFTG